VCLLLACYKKFVETHNSLINVREGQDILEELGVNGRLFIRVGVCEMDYQAQGIVSDRVFEHINAP